MLDTHAFWAGSTRVQTAVLAGIMGAVQLLSLALPAEAKQLCWNIAPYADILKVSRVNALHNHMSLNGGWLVGSTAKLMPVTGTLITTGDGLHKRIALFAAAAHVGFEECVLQATVDPQKLEGTATWTCNGGSKGPFAGTLDQIDCASHTSLNLGGALESWSDQ